MRKEKRKKENKLELKINDRIIYTLYSSNIEHRSHTHSDKEAKAKWNKSNWPVRNEHVIVVTHTYQIDVLNSNKNQLKRVADDEFVELNRKKHD